MIKKNTAVAYAVESLRRLACLPVGKMGEVALDSRENLCNIRCDNCGRRSANEALRRLGPELMNKIDSASQTCGGLGWGPNKTWLTGNEDEEHPDNDNMCMPGGVCRLAGKS